MYEYICYDIIALQPEALRCIQLLFMLMALGAMNKIGFVDGSMSTPKLRYGVTNMASMRQHGHFITCSLDFFSRLLTVMNVIFEIIFLK